MAIVYAYRVDGKPFESDQIRLGGNAEAVTPEAFGEALERYREGTRVTVFYDPADPATATLEPGAGGGVLGLFLIGAGLALVGAIVFVMTFFGAQQASAQ